MVKINNWQYVNLFETTLTKQKIGKIDIKIIKDETIDSLYYKFPLIERLIVEIYKCIPNSNVEKYNQGKMRTINSIIDNNIDLFILPEDIKTAINYYFENSDDSPRNKIFHVCSFNTFYIKVNFEMLNRIIAELLIILNNLSRQNKLKKIKKVEKI